MTTSLTVRRPAFAFDETIPFQWNRANPSAGIAFNTLSFIAPPFERFIVAAVRRAIEHITDLDVLDEAEAFLRQEAVHARAHRAHVQALVAQYPGLADVVVDLDQRFERLAEHEPLRFQLAYVADIEATFTPLFNIMLRHRDDLFDNGDHRVAPLFLWHLVEEIEHRSSGLIVYDAVVPSPWYRLWVLPRVVAHMRGCVQALWAGFDEHVPREERLVDTASGARDMDMMASVPRRERFAMLWRLLASQRPGHSPAKEVTPPFADEWLAAYDAGGDVVRWYEVAPS